MLLPLIAVFVQSTTLLAITIFAPRRPVLSPPHAPARAMAAHPVARVYPTVEKQRAIHVRAQAGESNGNHSSSGTPLARILPPSFPFADFPRASGLYTLTNRQTGSVYVGESGDILQRLRSHRSMLERGAHFCRDLQTDFDVHGIASFEVAILAQGPEYSDKAKRRAWEKAYINQLPSEKRYNLIDRQGERNSFAGKTHTLEFRERLSAERKGIPNTALGRPIFIPPFRTRKGNEHAGGTFASIAEASRVTGIARRDIRSRINDPLFPNWREIDPGFNAFEHDNSK